MKSLKIVSVVGARPNFVKIAPLIREMKKRRSIVNVLVHTGQHYSVYMSRAFLREFGLSRLIALNVGPLTPKRQMIEIKKRFRKILLKERPDLVIVVGDVNSTLACALTARSLKIKLAHIEAGLRSFDRTMPEERNRVITDSVSDLLFTTEPSGRRNLLDEGIDPKKIFFTGNIMIDSLVAHLKDAQKRDVKTGLGLKSGGYAVLTLHRPSNVDSSKRLSKIIRTLSCVSKRIKIVYPAHPRTVKMLKRFGLMKEIKRIPGLLLTRPMGYIDFLSLMKDAKFVMTDSGGMQEETTYLGIPCFTMRKNTERPITVTMGTNRIVDGDTGRLLRLINRLPDDKCAKVRRPKFWDGMTARRIVDVLLRGENGSSCGSSCSKARTLLQSPVKPIQG